MSYNRGRGRSYYSDTHKMATVQFNTEELIRLRERVSELEKAQSRLVARVATLATAISVAVPSAAALAPSVLHLG